MDAPAGSGPPIDGPRWRSLRRLWPIFSTMGRSAGRWPSSPPAMSRHVEGADPHHPGLSPPETALSSQTNPVRGAVPMVDHAEARPRHATGQA